MPRRNHLLVFVPGIMGSALRFRGITSLGYEDCYWVWSEDVEDFWRTLFRDPRELRAELQATHVLREIRFRSAALMAIYGDLLDFLRSDLGYRQDFKEFPYDWRQDNHLTADRLAESVGAQMRMMGKDHVRIVAHSMGCLVARLALLRHGALRSATDLLVQIAPPVAGSADAYYTLKREPRLGALVGTLRWLAEHLRRDAHHRLMSTLASFDSLYQLLPSEPILVKPGGKAVAPTDDEPWSGPEARSKVALARQLRQSVQSCGFPHTVTLYSSDVATDWGYNVNERFDVVSTVTKVMGDGRVSCESAVRDTPKQTPPGLVGRAMHTRVPIRARANHDRLPGTPDVLRELGGLLRR